MSATIRQPVLFLGHGSPMNAIEASPWRAAWADLGRRLPRPRAILCVSAHWETRGVYVTAAAAPETIHDFYGFPKALFDLRYPAPGDPALARRIAALGADLPIRCDPGRGLDHGAWSVLHVMYPQADVPVLQLSLDTRQPGPWHYALARRLAPLREEGVLIVGSGDIVHNLGLFRFHASAGLDWALRFRDEVNRRIAARDHAALADWPRLGTDAHLAIPTPEHYLPLLYALALERDDDSVETFNDDVISALSMTSLLIAPQRG
ncbi:MAG: 4,5-DOPA dioxygenase extradiol [Lysobacterales bacterium]